MSFFHLMGALSEFGKVGLTAIANSPEQADATYARALEVFDRRGWNDRLPRHRVAGFIGPGISRAALCGAGRAARSRRAGGSLILRMLGGARWSSELRDAFFYNYQLVGTCLVFALAGFLVGRRADRLRQGRDAIGSSPSSTP